MKNKVLKILFCLKNRNLNINRYFNLLKKYKKKQITFDLLIINDFKNKKLKLDKKFPFKIIYKNSNLKQNISGINDVFRSMYLNLNILKKYKYLCFVEDDNFIFPKAIIKCEKFLDDNNTYNSSNGKAFLFIKKKNYKYLNIYNLPNSLVSKNLLIRANRYKGGIFYYSLFRKKMMIKILKHIIKIKDNNLSEILFNYLSIKYGKHKNLNNIYLAREYPRPKIYNIPPALEWIKNKKLFHEIILIKKILSKKMKKSYINQFLSFTLIKYLSERFRYKKKKKLQITLKKNKSNYIRVISDHIYMLKKYS